MQITQWYYGLPLINLCREKCQSLLKDQEQFSLFKSPLSAIYLHKPLLNEAQSEESSYYTHTCQVICNAHSPFNSQFASNVSYTEIIMHLHHTHTHTHETSQADWKCALVNTQKLLCTWCFRKWEYKLVELQFYGTITTAICVMKKENQRRKKNVIRQTTIRYFTDYILIINQCGLCTVWSRLD